jgi:hypothetical protein
MRHIYNYFMNLAPILDLERKLKMSEFSPPFLKDCASS